MNRVRLQGIQAATLIWRIDLDDPNGPSEMLEAITLTSWEGHQVWRVTHYPLKSLNLDSQQL